MQLSQLAENSVDETNLYYFVIMNKSCCFKERLQKEQKKFDKCHTCSNPKCDKKPSCFQAAKTQLNKSTSLSLRLSVCHQPENLPSFILLQHPECFRKFQNVPECFRMQSLLISARRPSTQ